MEIKRLSDGPIITPGLCDSIGTNIQGPSLIAAPPWLEQPMGKYYLYFADHKGGHIRLAFADEVTGPWQIYQPGALQLSDSGFLTEPPVASTREIEELRTRYQQLFGPHYSFEQVLVDAVTPHIASPDVHLDARSEQVVMYFHGLNALGVQSTRVALATDGIHFVARPEVIGPSYFRTFDYRGWTYALVMPGQMRRSADGRSNFERGPQLFEPSMRHSAVWRRDDTLHVFWTRVGDAPESILHSTVDLRGDWMGWSDSEPERILSPERLWEGHDLAVEPSHRGAIDTRANQLRDPAIFVDGGRTYLLYSAAGESCIGLAEIVDLNR